MESHPTISLDQKTQNTKKKQQKEEKIDIALEGEGLPLFEYLSAYPYRTSVPLVLIKFFLVLCTGGIFGLVLLWNLKSNFWFERSCPVKDADKFLICVFKGDWRSVKVKTYKNIKYFQLNGLRYVFNGTAFILPPPPAHNWTHGTILEMSDGLFANDINDQIVVSEGKNIINVPTINLGLDILRELLRPDYIYIYSCCVIWFIHDYTTFGAIILATSLLGGLWDVWNRRKNRLHIKKMAKYIVDVCVIRDGEKKIMSSEHLIPGDVIELPEGGWKAPCDIALISGSAIVDESSLTGESLPIVKLKLGANPHKLYNTDQDKTHTIYGGTNVVGTVGTFGKKKPFALVVRTGWKTAKGNLIRSILNVREHEYIYEREAKIFLGILVVIGIGLFFISLWFQGVFDPENVFDPRSLLFGFEAIAILVPPMIPTLFQIGLVMSASILQDKYNVFTTDSSRIPLSGKIDIMCFDKTGTLTKEDLDMIGVVWPHENGFSEITPVSSIRIPDLQKGLVTCHQLGELNPDLLEATTTTTTTIKPIKPIHYSGPVVDIKIFESTGWEYHDGDGGDILPFAISRDSQKIEILKRFDFDPAVQRMSVIVKDSERITVFCKGSPEMIQACCDPSSLPINYAQETKRHSRNGCYVLALAYRPHAKLEKNLRDIRRTDIENDLIFVGFILLRNELKSDTKVAIKALKEGRVKMAIITGDNIYTAFYIAKKCGIVSEKKKCFIGDITNGELIFHDAYNSKCILDKATNTVQYKDGTKINLEKNEVAFGLTADAWEYLKDRGENKFLIEEVKIFARMKPLQKEAVVKLMTVDHIVGMCGDGANDCAALSAAHCGIALSEAEASVVSPFTAKSLSITAVVSLVREARACLANSFAVFKYTIIYGITQTTQAMFCYSYGGDLSMIQYITIDFIMFLPTAYFVAKSQSSSHLYANPPTARVFGPRTLSSILGITIIMLLSLLIAHFLLHLQSWYTPSTTTLNTTWYSIPEVTVTWFIGVFTYPASALACSFGGRWRKPFFYNIGLMVMVIFSLVLVDVLIWMYPEWDPAGIYVFFEFVQLPFEFRVLLFVIGVCEFVLQLFWEFVFVNKIGDLMGEKYGIGRRPVDDDIKSQAVGVDYESSSEEEKLSLNG